MYIYIGLGGIDMLIFLITSLLAYLDLLLICEPTGTQRAYQNEGIDSGWGVRNKVEAIDTQCP